MGRRVSLLALPGCKSMLLKSLRYSVCLRAGRSVVALWHHFVDPTRVALAPRLHAIFVWPRYARFGTEPWGITRIWFRKIVSSLGQSSPALFFQHSNR